MSASAAALQEPCFAVSPESLSAQELEPKAQDASAALGSPPPLEEETRPSPLPQGATPARAPSPLADVFEPGAVLQLSGGLASASTTTAVHLLGAAQRSGETTAWIQAEGGSLFPPDLAESGIDLDALVVLHIPVLATAPTPVKLAPAKLAPAKIGRAPASSRATTATTTTTTTTMVAKTNHGATSSSSTHGLCRAAEILLRSGAFGFVVLDLSSPGSVPRDNTWQSRLAALCRQHRARLLILTALPPARLARVVRPGATTTPHRSIESQLDRGAGPNSPDPNSPEEQSPASLGPMIRFHLAPVRTTLPDGQFVVQHPILKNKSGAPVQIADAQYRGPWGLR